MEERAGGPALSSFPRAERALPRGRHTAAVDAPNRELMREEDRLWRELHELVDSMPPDAATRPGYFEEGWSAKDLVAHIGSWLAEANVALEQIRSGTYDETAIDVDEMNARFYEAMKDVPFDIVRAQASAARNRMLQEWGALAEVPPEAEAWIQKGGPGHYAEHILRLRDWVEEVQGGSNASGSDSIG